MQDVNHDASEFAYAPLSRNVIAKIHLLGDPQATRASSYKGIQLACGTYIGDHPLFKEALQQVNRPTPISLNFRMRCASSWQRASRSLAGAHRPARQDL
jgi:hypothetical protein